MTAEDIFNSLPDSLSTAERVSSAAQKFLGLPYCEHPLSGSLTQQEQFVYSFEDFDCVTFGETCLALALTHSQSEFEDKLKSIRYLNGTVSWLNRNHYMYEWIKRNQDRGLVTPVVPSDVPLEYCKKTLSCLADYPPVEAELNLIPLQALNNIEIQSGDIMLFGSTKPDLDVFHLGITRIEQGDIFLIHASKSLGGVCEELLSHFLARNEISGLLLVRPVERV